MTTENTTKKEIFRAALDLFSRNGFAGTSIRMIAREVGIRESSIYNHFKSKEEILQSLIDEYRSITVSAKLISEELLDDISNPHLFMKNFCRKILEYWDTPHERKIIRLLMLEHFRDHGEFSFSLATYFEDLRQIWVMIFKEFEKHKIIKKTDPQLLANEFISYLYVLRIEFLSGTDKAGLRAAVIAANKHAEFIWKAIKKD